MPYIKSQPISNSSENNDPSPGFFASLFSRSKSKNLNSEEKICSELLNINKTVLIEQNTKLTVLKTDNKKLLDEINNLEKKYQRRNNQDQKENQPLEKEIMRLNNLIKILVTEIQ